MKYKILIVDDESANLRLLERLFRRSYQVVTASSGAEGLRLLELHDIALIISDQRMPGMTGVEFLKRASEMRARTVRIILTGYTDVNDLVDAINSGVVYKYITKPWVNEDLQLTVVRGLEHYEAFKERHDLTQQNARLSKDLAATREGFVRLISEALRGVDPTNPERCRRIADHAGTLGRWLDIEEDGIEQLSLAARLCEIRRLGMDGDFWATILDEIPEMEDAASSMRFQHAHFDGNGTLEDISGERIPLYARILSVAAAFDSHMFPAGKEALTEDEALKALRLDAGSKFDPALVEAFCTASAIGPMRPEMAEMHGTSNQKIRF